MREMYGFLRLANPFGHPSQFRTQVLSLQTCVACVDLRGRLARALEYTPRLFEIPDVLLRLVSKNALQIIILVSSLSEKSLKNMEFRCVSPVKRLFDTRRKKNPNSAPPCNNFFIQCNLAVYKVFFPRCKCLY